MNTISIQVERKYRLARIWSNRELARIAHHFSGDIVNISGNRDEDKEGRYYCDYFINKHSYSITNYIGDNGYQETNNELLLDITQELPINLKHRFDVAFNHTTLEHVFNVFQAFKTICELSRDIVIIVVPFAQIQHAINMSYDDYWRFTPSVIRRLFQENNLEVVYEAESPYTHAAVYLFFVGSRQPDKWKGILPSYTPIKQAGTWIGEQKISFLKGIRTSVCRL
ncbi:hypothetical protein [Chroococcidiopsis sp. TS-821]|uniref:hypothetical protein n=1 Tax=Chroococcidiopsis sp. TS-821 TaxID=1378066 RepID=UPI000CEEEDCF|nr:hypothetical protein [Chroococcidiopsis sp. TS-821]PPS45552.1 hypothetical protein B1A85_04705 [Chroococcidiopsis sp. TS-821]